MAGTFGALIGLFAIGAALRSRRIDIIFDPRGVRVTNYWCSWRVGWERIESVTVVERKWYQHWLSYGVWLALALDDGSEVPVQALSNSGGGSRHQKEAILAALRELFGEHGVPVEVAISGGPPSWICTKAERGAASAAARPELALWRPATSGEETDPPARTRIRSSRGSLEEMLVVIGVVSAFATLVAAAIGAALRLAGRETLLLTPSPWWVVLLALASPAILYGLIRAFSLRLRADADGVSLREMRDTIHLPWVEIRAFLVPGGLPGVLGPGSLAIEGADGQIHGVTASRRCSKRKRRRQIERLWQLSREHDVAWHVSELAR